MANAWRYVTLTLPKTGTVRLTGNRHGGISSDGALGLVPAGYYEPRVDRWGQVTFGGIERGYSLRIPTMQLTVDDQDGAVQAIVASGENLFNAPATIGAVFSDGMSPSTSWALNWVLKSWSRDDAKQQWTLTVGADDTALNREIIFPIRQQDFPNAPLQSLLHRPYSPHVSSSHKKTVATTSQLPYGIAAPVIYGLNDSAGTQNNGACPVIHVDNVNFYGLVSWGWVNVIRAYKGGVRQTFPSAAVSQVHLVIGGQMYTLLAFSTDQSSQTWTVDVQGYETVGDGSGTLITKAGDQLLHFLRNVACLGTTPPVRGIWNASGGDVIAGDFALATMAVRAGGSGYQGGRYIGQSTTPIQEINAWAGWQIQPYLWVDGNLGLQWQDPQETAVNWNDGNRWYRYSKRDMTGLACEFDRDGLVGSVKVSPNTLATGGQPLTPLTVVNPLSKSNAQDPVSLGWGPMFQ